MGPSRNHSPRIQALLLTLLAALAVLYYSLSARAQPPPEGQSLAEGVPSMDWSPAADQVRRCLSDAEGNLVFLQCSPGRCLYSDRVDVERIAFACSYSEGSFEWLAESGKVEMVYARREAPRGWHRDESGRVYQVTFDLRRRFFLGGGYSPTLALGGGSVDHRAFFELGFIAEWDTQRGLWGLHRRPRRLRVSLLEADVMLSPLALDGTLLRFERARLDNDGGVRVTTFFGEPTRHDLGGTAGWGFEFARSRVGILGRPSEQSEMRWVAPFLLLDLLQRREVDNSLRLRVGPGVLSSLSDEVDAAPMAASLHTNLQALITPDRAGLSSFDLKLSHERYYPLGSGAAFYDGHELAGSVGYERVLLAINDQPLSWTIGTEALWRPQLEEPNAEVRATSSLRFSLWAPARRDLRDD